MLVELFIPLGLVLTEGDFRQGIDEHDGQIVDWMKIQQTCC